MIERPGACPSCSQPMAGNAVLCIQCGFNRQTGKHMQTVVAGPQPKSDPNPYASPRSGESPGPGPGRGGGTRLCTEARDALIIAILGFFCCAIILEPWALIKATNAKARIQANSRLHGAGLATVAQILAAIGLVLWGLVLLGNIGRIAQMQ
ncbi:MAG: hypothetical protein HQ567_16880 [Candidatus Nealsonbacteria bacterium]|nr:hypothetical protein [Candidatus Nealsonbacteria bacterium]